MTREEVLEVIAEEPYRIGQWVGFKDLTTLHNEWIKSFLFEKEDMTLQAHRGSYKTTCLSVFLALVIVIRPTIKTLFFRKTDDDVVEIVSQVKNILRSGCMQIIVQALYGFSLKIIKETQAEVNTNLNTDTKGASQLLGLGIKTSMTGKHADLVITDDIVNLTDRISPAERNRIKLAYNELQNIKNRGGRIINTGTPWHKEDAFTLMPNIKKYDCYTTGLISPEQLKALRSSMTDSLFAANYELKHIADADAMFKEPRFCSDEGEIYGGKSHVDASYGGEDGTAYTVIKKRPDGSYVAYGKLWHRHVDDCLDDIERLQKQMRAGSISCETNGDKGYLAREMQERGLYVRKYAERMNKFVKIASYLRKNWEHIEWLESTDPEYLSQILDYTEFAQHDDAPDSAASLLREMERTGGFQAFEGGL